MPDNMYVVRDVFQAMPEKRHLRCPRGCRQRDVTV